MCHKGNDGRNARGPQLKLWIRTCCCQPYRHNDPLCSVPWWSTIFMLAIYVREVGSYNFTTAQISVPCTREVFFFFFPLKTNILLPFVAVETGLEDLWPWNISLLLVSTMRNVLPIFLKVYCLFFQTTGRIPATQHWAASVCNVACLLQAIMAEARNKKSHKKYSICTHKYFTSI